MAGVPARGFVALNGRVTGEGESSGAFLAERPAGVYTTMRTVELRRVLKFDEHVRRLAGGVRAGGHDDAMAGRVLADDDEVRALVGQDLREVCAEVRRRRPGLEASDLRVTVLLLLRDGAAGALRDSVDRHVFVSEMPSRRDGGEVFAAVARAGRERAHVKDSAWAAEARVLRAAAPEGAEEVVMEGADGRIGEGLSSNFFAVLRGEVWTAEDGVLAGTVRSLVLDACRDLGVPVRLEGPRAADAASFEGALVSSTSRLALPLARLQLASGESVRFDLSPGSVARRVQEAVRARVAAESEEVLAAAVQ